ncbi:MAG: twin-arginine translocase TatA/TatE family subunit [Thermoplasmata archaeon]|jgi:sec-independent protein translocase protein TatA
MFDSIDDWLIIAVVVGILFYGSSKIPQLANALGRSMGEFKRGKQQVEREMQSESTTTIPPVGAGTSLPPAGPSH